MLAQEMLTNLVELKKDSKNEIFHDQGKALENGSFFLKNSIVLAIPFIK